ncbi:HEXXH motif-containing putative peptide modification protein [Streptomyces sp. NPDC056144]|uniref:aKG-HExxH-type peptide beta-hydroxylase n=1 Tax=unclassified Streptomyces TaxID=2593676 RepID=UPI0035DB6D24
MSVHPPSPPVSPQDLWRSLAAGVPGPAVLAALRTARRNRNLLLLRVAHRRHRTDPRWAAAVALLAEVRRARPEVFADVLGGPEAGAWLGRHAGPRGPEDGAAHDTEGGAAHDTEGGSVRDTDGEPAAGLARFAAAAALRAGIGFRVAVPVADGATLVLPGLGAVLFPEPGPLTATVLRDGTGALVVRDGGERPVAIHGADGAEGWFPLPRVRLGARTTVRLDSLDPLRLGGPTALPPRPLSPAEHAGWSRRLDASWQVLTDRHPERAETVAEVLRVLVPLTGEDATGWRSASFGDAAGLVALSPVDDPVELAADLVHETQHSLLYAATDLVDLLDSPPGARADAPWSDRPRPPAALLHGGSAFLVTAGFWRTELRHGNPAARRPYEHWRRTAAAALAVLTAHDDWTTEDGRVLLGALRAVLASWAEGDRCPLP